MNEPSWRMFDRIADSYDEVVPFFADNGAAIMAQLDPPPGCQFLDLGAGRGALTGPALDRGCLVTAVDAAPAMVAHLADSYPAATAYVMDAQALAFPTGSFDLVAAAFVIHVLDVPAAGVAEAHRVLAPGGRFALTGGSSRDSPSPTPPPLLGRRLVELFTEFGDYLPPGGGMGQPVDAAELLEQAGFTDLRQHRVEAPVRVADNQTLWRWMLSHGYRAFIDDLREERRREFRDRVLTLPDDDRTLQRGTGLWSGRKPG
jgi:ubiquinone/menaquinone biosynthesis C-methylase UbiE